jgi:hypothetical protein
MVKTILGLLALLAFAGLGCGGESNDETGSGGSSAGGAGGTSGAGGASGGVGGSLGLCVSDPKDPGSCPVSWVLLDPCPMLPENTTLELAVFDGGCPADQDLRSGATASAITRASFAPTQSFSPIEGLTEKKYGFAFVARAPVDCAVVAFGCTEADPSTVSEIRTAICDWSVEGPAGAPTCSCKLMTGGGGCSLPETCAAGVCSGVAGG